MINSKASFLGLARSKIYYSYLRLLLTGVVLLLLPSGCSFLAPALPVIDGEELLGARRDQVLNQLSTYAAEVSSFRGISRAQIRFGKEVSFLRQVIVFEKPDRLRLEYMPTHAIYTLSLLTANQVGAVFIDVSEKKVWQSRKPEILMRKLIHSPISINELIAVFAGRVREDLLSEPGLSLYYDAAAGSFILVTTGFERLVVLDQETLQLRKVELRSSKGTRLDMVIRYDQYQEIDDTLLPLALNISVPRHDFSMDLMINALSVNQSYPQSLYQADLPEAFKLERLD